MKTTKILIGIAALLGVGYAVKKFNEKKAEEKKPNVLKSSGPSPVSDIIPGAAQKAVYNVLPTTIAPSAPTPTKQTTSLLKKVPTTTIVAPAITQKNSNPFLRAINVNK